MSDDSRRNFLKWLAAAPAAAVGVSSCSTSSDGAEGIGGAADTGSDGATGPGNDSGGYPVDPSDTGEDGPDAGENCEPTGSDVEGPFHREGAPERTQLAPDDEPGTPMIVSGTVWEADCQTPIADAMLDIWHANDDGDYYDGEDDYRLRGQMQTDENGQYEYETIRPGNYPLRGTTRPAHIHYNVSAPDFQPLTTQLYFSDDPNLAPDDPCGGCNSGDSTLIVDVSTEQRDGAEVQIAQFDIVLVRAS